MARKSKELRLSQSKELLASFDAAGLQSDYRYRFIRDMISRLGRDRGLSQKQRKWLDSLIEEGVPAPKGDPILIAEIMGAASLDGMQHRRQVLNDFAGRINRGHDLSPNQAKFLDLMLQEAKEIQANGKFQPGDIKALGNAYSLLSGKSEWYWAHRRGTGKAYSKVGAWLEWNTLREVIKEIKDLGKESSHVLYDEPHIDEWCCNKVMTAAKTGLSELNNPSHPVGSLRYVSLGGKNIHGVIMSLPRVDGNKLYQDVLVSGELKAYLTEEIRKRK